MAEIHIVTQGECLSSLAKTYGFVNWRTIYEHPQNAAFKRKRPNPNQIYPGDEIFIPDLELKEEARNTEKKHPFKIKAHPILLRLVVKDENLNPFLGRKYELTLDGLPEPYSGMTSNSNGKIEHPKPSEPKVSPDTKEGQLTIWLSDDSSRLPAVWRLSLGHLDPIEELTGVQKRLANLGFPIGVPDGDLNGPTTEALAAFQALVDLDKTGNDDQKTQNALIQHHDKLGSSSNEALAAPLVIRANGYIARLHKDSPPDELSATLSFQRVFRFSI